MEDKRIVVKFEVICETDTSMVDGNTVEEKVNNWKDYVEDILDHATRGWGDVWSTIKCKEAKAEDYE